MLAVVEPGLHIETPNNFPNLEQFQYRVAIGNPVHL